MENFNLFNEDDNLSPMERLFEAYIQQCMSLQLMYLDSWMEMKRMALENNTIDQFNHAIEKEMEFLSELIILKDE
jgi:hypothetical protein